MYRTTLIWVFIGSLLVCPMRCSKSLQFSKFDGGQIHQHCCFDCHHSAPTDFNDKGDEPAPDSGCGCLHCICKGALTASSFDPSEAVAFFLRFHQMEQWTLVRAVAVPAMDFAFLWHDPLCSGRGMRLSLQSWLI